jgi:hypothetical protein
MKSAPVPDFSKERSEEHEQDHVRGGDGQRDPEDPVGGQVQLVNRELQREAPVLERRRKIRSEEGIGQEGQGGDGEGRTDRAPGGL